MPMKTHPLLSQICDKTSQKRFGKGQNRAEMGWAPVGPLMGFFSTEMRNSLFSLTFLLDSQAGDCTSNHQLLNL